MEDREEYRIEKEIEDEIEDEENFMDEGDLDQNIEGRIVLEKIDRSLSEYSRWNEEGKLVADTDWQRNYVWDSKRSSRLIESFLKNIPVPVVYLYQTEDSKYEVIDGKQRLTTICNFFSNKFKLQNLEFFKEFNGSYFRDLPKDYQEKLKDSSLRSYELIQKVTTKLLSSIFERLNTGGVHLNEMEIRNCTRRSPVMDLIKKLALNKDFVTVCNQKNLDKRMHDRYLVLRFLSFYEKTYQKMTKGLKSFLEEFLEYYKDANEDKMKEFEKAFSMSMKACLSVFGKNSFRLRKINSTGNGEWVTFINAPIFQVISVSFTKYKLEQITRKADSIYEAYVDLIGTDEKWIDCVKSQTADKSRIDYVFETWDERLKLAIGDEKPNDTKRIFSMSLKKELFNQDNICHICGNEIKLLLDAALDHDKHYWRGGLTVPENARLVHRNCNLHREH
jgi:hypothetical protein